MSRTKSKSCLIVAHNYHPLVGAAATRLQLLAASLQEQGFRVTVLTSAADAELVGPHGERVIGTSRSWMPGSRLFRTIVLAARALLAGRCHDVVVSDPPPHVAVASMMGARLAGRPGIFYYCDSWASVASSRQSLPWRTAGRLFLALEHAASRLAELTVAATPSLAQQANRTSGRVEVVRNGTDLSVYTPQGERWQGELPQQPYFLYAGTMGLVHGADVFLAAARKLWDEGHEFSMVFVGSGAQAEPIREAAAASHGRILFLDPVTPAQVASLYRTNCVGALSSMRPVPGYEDAWPVKTLAAMACGALPVYVSGGSLAETLRQQGLGFVQPFDQDGARDVMLAALQLDAPARDEMSRRCADYASEHFDQRRAAQTVAEAAAEAFTARALRRS